MQSNQLSVKDHNKKALKLKVPVWTRFAPGSGLSIRETYQTISKQQNSSKKLNLTKST